MIKVPSIVKKIFFKQVWDIPNTENKVYLTFDDGPTPEVTNWVLEILAQENIKATFFCIGNNIEKNPELFKKTIEAGHSIGNHTFNHVKGWKTPTNKYLEEVFHCTKTIQKHTFSNQKSAIKNLQSRIFRPPYGKISVWQSIQLRKKGYKIIMWDILTKDYDVSISPEQCLENAVRKTTSGSIIVFHDSLKAKVNLKYTLPKAIKILKEKGFVFDTIL